MENPNAVYGADVVIAALKSSPLADRRFAVWRGGDVIANVNLIGCNMLVAGASAQKLSVYDVHAAQFLCGSVAQLVG